MHIDNIMMCFVNRDREDTIYLDGGVFVCGHSTGRNTSFNRHVSYKQVRGKITCPGVVDVTSLRRYRQLICQQSRQCFTTMRLVLSDILA